MLRTPSISPLRMDTALTSGYKGADVFETPIPSSSAAHGKAAVLWGPESMPGQRVPLPDRVAAATFMQCQVHV